MRTALILVVATLAGCNQEPGPVLVESQESPEFVQPMGPGLYAIGDGEAVYVRTRLAEDGTYQDMDEAGTVVGGGTWFSASPGICFDPEGDGEDQQARCWRNDPPNTDGSFRTQRVDGDEAYTITPLDE